MSGDPVLVPIARIRRTEEICPRRVVEVLASIRERGAWTHPICIEATVGALLDGHHRFAAARILGLRLVPVRVFDYAEVELSSWRPETMPTRADVLTRALSGELYPLKTTRHVFVDRFMAPIPLAELVRDHADVATVREAALQSAATPPRSMERARREKATWVTP